MKHAFLATALLVALATAGSPAAADDEGPTPTPTPAETPTLTAPVPAPISAMVAPPNLSFNHNRFAPDGWELVYRSVIVRLGPEWNWYENSGHGSAGILGVSIDANRNLVVKSDFDASKGEIILNASASPDAQLVLKGVVAGASGGTSTTRYTITSTRDLTGYKAYSRIRPNAKVFNSKLDNLWIQQVSMRPIQEQDDD